MYCHQIQRELIQETVGVNLVSLSVKTNFFFNKFVQFQFSSIGTIAY